MPTPRGGYAPSQIHDPRLLNGILKELRDYSGEPEGFKSKLDKFVWQQCQISQLCLTTCSFATSAILLEQSATSAILLEQSATSAILLKQSATSAILSWSS